MLINLAFIIAIAMVPGQSVSCETWKVRVDTPKNRPLFPVTRIGKVGIQSFKRVYDVSWPFDPNTAWAMPDEFDCAIPDPKPDEAVMFCVRQNSEKAPVVVSDCLAPLGWGQ